MVRVYGSAEPFSSRRRPGPKAKNWARAADGLPGDAEGGMSRRGIQRKHGTTRGLLRRTRTAKASRINRTAAKSGCAREWGAGGRLSVDGRGQQNPDRSEG